MENSPDDINIPITVENNTCRICFEEQTNTKDPLISPCRCTGTSKYIHHSCLQKWRLSNLPNSDPRKKCMECNTEYIISYKESKCQYVQLGFYYFIRHYFTICIIVSAFNILIMPELCNTTYIKFGDIQNNNSCIL